MEYRYQQGEKAGVFTCVGAQYVEEQNAVLYEFVHEESGARLLWLATSDKNKLFSVAFKTTPEDDTGVFHILEHSVLCGSQKYPVKEPFVELLKSSMNTFLNAMTFPDKTLYPVSSRNEQDFLNLTSVYLDAVFRPAIYENPNIFYQEGWHYEYREGDENPVYKGVVFNEMKGVESSVDSLIDNEMMRALYPDTCYGYVSGGDSRKIPELTYEEFLRRHSRFYHPSNAIFYLEGEMDITKPISMIEEYVAGAESGCEPVEIALQTPVKAKRVCGSYAVAPGESCEKKTRIAFGKIICDCLEKEKYYAANLLAGYLTESNEAPLKRAILEKGLAQDIRVRVNGGIRQPFLSIQVSNTEGEQETQILKTIREVVSKEIEQGIDRTVLEASLNQYEFSSREVVEPRGLYHNVAVLDSYLYGGDPSLNLRYNDCFAFLREKLQTDYFEKLLEEMMDEDDLVTVVMVPSDSLGAKNEEEERVRLQTACESWSAKQRTEILEQNRVLDAWQMTADTKEQLSCLPRLDISEVDELPEQKITEEMEHHGVKILVHPCGLAGIAYLNLYFAVPEAYKEQLSELALMSSLIGKVPPKQRGLMELIQDIKKNLGNLSFDVDAFCRPGELDTCRVYFTVSCSVLKDKIPDAVRLIYELLTETDFSKADYVKNTLLQMREGLRNGIIANGHQFGMRRAAAGLNSVSAAVETLSGVTYYEKLKKFCEEFGGEYEEFLNFIETVRKQCFCRNNCMVSVTAHAGDVKKAEFLDEYHVKELIDTFASGVERTDSPAGFAMDDRKRGKTFIQIPAAVSYAEAAGNLYQTKMHNTGVWKVAAKIVSLAYLWNEVRVQGGAYGVGLSVGTAGNLGFYSYRDPDAMRSYSVYAKSGEFLRQFVKEQESLHSFIISTISDMEPLLTPEDEGRAADYEYLRGVDYAMLCAERTKLLHTSKEDLLYCADALDSVWENPGMCLVAAEESGFEAEKKIVI